MQWYCCTGYSAEFDVKHRAKGLSNGSAKIDGMGMKRVTGCVQDCRIRLPGLGSKLQICPPLLLNLRRNVPLRISAALDAFELTNISRAFRFEQNCDAVANVVVLEVCKWMGYGKPVTFKNKSGNGTR
jgi:hypothetical protein